MPVPNVFYDSVLRKYIFLPVLTRRMKYVMSGREVVIYTPGCFIVVCNWIKRQYFRGYLRGQVIATRLRRRSGEVNMSRR